MKRILTAAAISVAASSAMAADPVVYQDPPFIPVDTISTGWEGFYAGVQAGYGFGSTGQIQLNPFTFGPLVTAFTPPGAAPGSSFNANGDFNAGLIGGAHVGYDWQTGNIVFGGILDVSYADLSDEQRAFSRTPAEYVITRDIDYLVTLRGRVGYALDDSFLIYATGGAAYGDVNFSYRQGALSPASTVTPSGGQDHKIGYAVGAGMEARLTENWSFGVEYLYTNLGSNDYVVNLQGGPFGGAGGAPGSNPGGTNLTGTDGDFDFHAITAKLSYRF